MCVPGEVVVGEKNEKLSEHFGISDVNPQSCEVILCAYLLIQQIFMRSHCMPDAVLGTRERVGDKVENVSSLLVYIYSITSQCLI